jgi:hypothetical protein
MLAYCYLCSKYVDPDDMKDEQICNAHETKQIRSKRKIKPINPKRSTNVQLRN